MTSAQKQLQGYQRKFSLINKFSLLVEIKHVFTFCPSDLGAMFTFQWKLNIRCLQACVSTTVMSRCYFHCLARCLHSGCLCKRSDWTGIKQLKREEVSLGVKVKSCLGEIRLSAHHRALPVCLSASFSKISGAGLCQDKMICRLDPVWSCPSGRKGVWLS